jgi:ParB family transcriptional regulator, chromosome partitioning protein
VSLNSLPTPKKKGLPDRVRMRHSSHFVEELTSRSEQAIGRMVPISAIMPDPGQPRSTMGDLSELAKSIMDKGVLEPILLRSRPEAISGSAQFLIISGERRFRASMEAGLEEVPAIIMEVGDEEALEIALIENLQRKDLTPFEEAEGYKALSERFAYTHEQISKAVGKSRTVITESFALLQIPRPVRDAAQALGIQTKSILLEVLKAKDPEEMIRMLEVVSQRGMSRDDLRSQTRSDKNKDGSERRRPFLYTFKPLDKSFSLALKFRQAAVSKSELISTLETILSDLRAQPDPAGSNPE